MTRAASIDGPAGRFKSLRNPVLDRSIRGCRGRQIRQCRAARSQEAASYGAHTTTARRRSRHGRWRYLHRSGDCRRRSVASGRVVTGRQFGGKDCFRPELEPATRYLSACRYRAARKASVLYTRRHRRRGFVFGNRQRGTVSLPAREAAERRNR